MTLAIAGTIAAYIVIAVLLLSINLKSTWKWWIKAGTIIVTTLFYAGSYAAIVSMLGWPTRSRMPEHFQFLSAQIIEPDKLTGEAGTIYLWIAALDENNNPEERPRAFELPYNETLANEVAGAQDKRNDGAEVAGTVEYGEEVEEDTTAELSKLEPNSERTSKMDTVPFMEQDMRVSFQELPPTTLPPKPPL